MQLFFLDMLEQLSFAERKENNNKDSAESRKTIKDSDVSENFSNSQKELDENQESL